MRHMPAAAIALAAALALSGCRADDEIDRDAHFAAERTTRSGAHVATYREHVETIERDDVIVTMTHDYVAGALRLLADALDEIMPAGTAPDHDAALRLAELRRRSAEITGDWRTLDHVVQVREAALIAVDILEDLRTAHRTGDDREIQQRVHDARAAATSISTVHLLQAQRERVFAFLRATAEAVEALAV